jgi:hypothetical protein
MGEFVLPEWERKTPVECTDERGVAYGYGTWAELCVAVCKRAKSCKTVKATGLKAKGPVPPPGRADPRQLTLL